MFLFNPAVGVYLLMISEFTKLNQWCSYLFKWRIRDAEAAEAHVSERLLQLPEQAGIRSVFEALIGEQIGQLLADHLDQLGFRNVVVDEASDVVYIPWEEDRKSFLEWGSSK